MAIHDETQIVLYGDEPWFGTWLDFVSNVSDVFTDAEIRRMGRELAKRGECRVPGRNVESFRLVVV